MKINKIMWDEKRVQFVDEQANLYWVEGLSITGQYAWALETNVANKMFVDAYQALKGKENVQ